MKDMYDKFNTASLPLQELKGFSDLCNEVGFIITSYLYQSLFEFIEGEAAYDAIEEIINSLCYIPVDGIDSAFALIENRIAKAQDDIADVFFETYDEESDEVKQAVRLHILQISADIAAACYTRDRSDYITKDRLVPAI